MANITAAAVKELREKTQLPMMKCKEALKQTEGDIAAAIEWLRKELGVRMESRTDRSTEEGRVGLFQCLDKGVGAMVEIQCESAPVASNPEFIQLATDLATQLATGPGAATGEELLAQNSPSTGSPLQTQLSDLSNKMGEVFRVTRLVRVDGPCGGYVHHDGKTAVLLQVEGGAEEPAKDICMHVAAMRPQVLNVSDLDPAVVDKERNILTEQARAEGKPDNIIEKMVEGRLRNFYAGSVLSEQPFVKDDKQTVAKYAESNGMKLVQFQCWQLGS